MNKNLKIAAVCAVSLAMGILCALLITLLPGSSAALFIIPSQDIIPNGEIMNKDKTNIKTSLPCAEVTEYPAENVEYGTSFSPLVISNTWYGDYEKIHSMLVEAKNSEDNTKTLELLYESVREAGSYSRYTDYLDTLNVEREGKKYGAYVNEGDSPIGGGIGYKAIITTGDHIVSNAKELLEALETVKSGEVIFIKGDAAIELTMISAEKGVLKIPAGVTLASDRGYVREDGTVSRGAVFIQRHLSGRVFEVYGNARITGLTLQGANPNRCLPHHYRSFSVPNPPMHAYYNKLTTASTDGFVIMESGVEIDNCEITGFGHAAIFINHGEIKDIHVHHCYIHHNQTQGRGYGVSHGDGAVSIVEYNLFNFNRHSIASTGKPPTAYIARFNVEMGESLQHCFDMHGGGDYGRTDGTNIAGEYCEMYNNTFLCDANPYLLRGVPLEYQFFRNNVLLNKVTDYNWSRLNGKNVEIKDNVYDLKTGELRIQ
ncbi:MAG: hypothetical protein E7665_04955 [Ruminococcaceae bacterium]|nr:hypothetical protein [Oscillospiraceae bacterium]